MRIERYFEVPPLRLQKSHGLRPGYLYYATVAENSIEGCGQTPREAILDLRRTRDRLRRHPSKPL